MTTASKPPRWKLNAKHLKIALERLVHNFAVHAKVSKSEALDQIEKALKEIRSKLEI